MRNPGGVGYVAIALSAGAVVLAGAGGRRGTGVYGVSPVCGVGDVCGSDNGRRTCGSPSRRRSRSRPRQDDLDGQLRQLPRGGRARDGEGQEPDPIAHGAARSEWQRDRAVPEEGSPGGRRGHDADRRADQRPGAIPPPARQRLVPRLADLRAAQRADRRCQGRRGLLHRRGQVQHVPLADRRSRRDRQEIRADRPAAAVVFPRPPRDAAVRPAGADARHDAPSRSRRPRGRRSPASCSSWTISPSRCATTSGATRTFERTPALKVEKNDPLAAHRALLDTITDKNIHDVVAYLETLK